MAPDALRDALLDAASARDDARLGDLVAKQRETIEEHFPSWQKVPEKIRGDDAQTRRYVEGLIAIADHFKTELADPSLLDRIAVPPESNPLVQWEKALRGAQDAIKAARYAEAEAALEEQRVGANGKSGTGVDRYLPITLGLLGQCRFHQAKITEAIPLFEEALAICERTQDADGRIAYLSSLHEAHRWFRRTEDAASYADRLGDACERAGNLGRASWARRRARIVREGEPLNRVVVEVSGKQIELEDLVAPLPDGRVRFHFERNRIALGGVSALVEEGSRLGSEGDDAGALAKFRAAAEIDPTDPRPHYFSGLAQMGLRRYPDAVESYEATERLAPGWYHCRADRALALELASKRITHATFEAVRRIEDGGRGAEERVTLADQALADAPDLPILHLMKTNALIELKSAAGAEEAARAGLARDPDPDVRTRLLVAMARVVKAPEARRILEEAVTLDGNLIAGAMARVMLLPPA